LTKNLAFGGAEGAAQEFLSLDKINALFTTVIDSLSGLFDVLLKNISAYGSKLVSSVANIIMSLFISFYLLASKEKRLAQVKKLISALFNEKRAKFIFDTASLAHNAFGSFIGAKILDSFIVGILEYIVFSIFGIPYAPMLACVMGITNIIPFFGPIIGAIPSGFIVLISDPSKLIPFLIIMLVVQQTDANIIEPKILSDRTGVSSLCVIVAISVMGNLWGVFGMVVGVPLFSVVLALVEQYTNARLSARGMSVDLDDYYREEPQYMKALAQGHAKLSKRYYWDKLGYALSGKKRKGKKPNKQDYMIYPTSPEQDTATQDTVTSDSEKEQAPEEVLEPILPDADEDTTRS
jgi:predicted PurR-regulated permease PerM